jgi:hypothetical protein
LEAAQTPWQKKYPLVDNFVSLLAEDLFSTRQYSHFSEAGGAETAMELFDTSSVASQMERELHNAHDEAVDYEANDWAEQVAKLSPVTYRFTKWFKHSYWDELEAHNPYA